MFESISGLGIFGVFFVGSSNLVPKKIPYDSFISSPLVCYFGYKSLNLFIPGGRAALGTPSPGGMWVLRGSPWVPMILDGMNWGTHQRSRMFVLVFLIMLLWLLCFTMYDIYDYITVYYVWFIQTRFLLTLFFMIFFFGFSKQFWDLVRSGRRSHFLQFRVAPCGQCSTTAAQGPKKWTRTEVWGLGVFLGVSVNALGVELLKFKTCTAELVCWRDSNYLQCIWLEMFSFHLISKKLMKYMMKSEKIWINEMITSFLQFPSFFGIFWVNKKTRRWGSLQSLSWFDGWRCEAGGHLMVIWWDFCWWFNDFNGD